MSKTKAVFSQSFLLKIKELLQAQKIHIEEELGGIANKSGTQSANALMPDYGDKDDENAMEVAEFTANIPLEMTLEKELRDTDKSLERLEKGSYGVCKYCDKPIDEKRLLARPTSSACVSCKKTLTDEV